MLVSWLVVACVDVPKPVDPGTPGVSDGPCEPLTWYADADADGFGAAESEACEAPVGHVALRGDCDDGSASVHPDAAELCDGLDQDCDGVVDEGLTLIDAAPDTDADGYGDAAAAASVCALPAGWVVDATDCDDTNAAIAPDQLEYCNGYDDDCDALVDDADSPFYGPATWYADVDGDAYGDDDDTLTGCEAPEGYVAAGGDCDVDDPTINPGAAEICLDLIDQDCDGYTDDHTDACIDAVAVPTGLCDPALVPVAEALCTAGLAAVLPTGAGYTTVQAAIDAAARFDIVTVCPGTWVEDLEQTVSPLSFVGYGAGVSVLQGAGSTVIHMGTGSALNLIDLDVQDGFGDGSGFADGYGGGLYGRDAILCVSRSRFLDNEADGSGGGIYLQGGGTLEIEDTTFASNRAVYDGGALYVDNYTVTVVDSTFEDNESTDRDGGAVEIDTQSLASFYRTTFTDNRADGDGGAVGYGGTAPAGTLDFFDTRFDGNIAGNAGGALSIEGDSTSTVSCISCTFDGNIAAFNGGAVVSDGSGDPTFDAIRSTFTDNSSVRGGAYDQGGRGISHATFLGCTLEGNAAETGGAVYVTTSRGLATLTTIESSVTSNSADTCGGGSVGFENTQLWSIDTDWGTGASDNAPDDICDYTGYGAAADFLCTRGSCL